MTLTSEAFDGLEALAHPRGPHTAELLDKQNVRLLAILEKRDTPRFAAIMGSLNRWVHLPILKEKIRAFAREADKSGARTKAETTLKEKLDAAKEASRPVIERGAPRDTAGAFRCQRHPHLYFAEGEYLEHEVNCYRPRDELLVRAQVSAFMAEGVDSETGEDFKPGKRDVDEVMDAVRSLSFREGLTSPAWIDYEPLLDPDPWQLLPCANGLYDLHHDCLYPNTPRFFARCGLTYAYDPDAPDATAFLAFLESIWPEQGVPPDVAAANRQNKMTLQEIFGHLLTVETKYQKIFFLLGQSRGGKGVVIRILTKLLGPANVASQSASKFGKEFGLHQLIGKSAGFIPDVRLGRNSNLTPTIIEMLLSISGEDDVAVGRKFLRDWAGKLHARLVLASNMELVLPDMSGALHNRLIPLVFKKSFADNPDVTLDDKLAAELPSILNWAIEGLKRLEARVDERGFKLGFIIPPDGKKVLNEMARQGSTVQAFLRERCTMGRDEYVPKEALFEAFEEWCTESDISSHYVLETFAKEVRVASGYNVGSVRKRVGEERVQCFSGVALA